MNASVSNGTIGVVIRTLNESELIGRCIETLRGQQGGFELDVLVVDSGSTDSTLEIAREHGARILELAPTEFDYSKALNLGIEQVRGDLAVSLSAHAIPADEHLLERLTAPFDDPKVAGVAARQAAMARRAVAGGASAAIPVHDNSDASSRASTAPRSCSATRPRALGGACGPASRSPCPQSRTSNGLGASFPEAGRSSTSPRRRCTTRTTRIPVRRHNA